MAISDQKRSLKDPFLELLQGPSIEVVIETKTPTTTPQIYHLPQNLLSAHSIHFRDEIAKPKTSAPDSKDNDHASPTFDELLDSVLEPTAKPTSISIPPLPPTASPKITLKEVDPTIFGLFLRFIYQGGYPSSVDALPTFGPGSTMPYTSDPIPASLRAWTIGAFLKATTFQNHAITHVYQSLGMHFALTPTLVSWVWSNAPADGEGKCPLRSLVMDVLAMHWGTPTKYVAKFAALDDAWNELFNKHADLRRDFIFGLQGRRIQALQAYLIETPAPATAIKVKKESFEYSPTLLGLTVKKDAATSNNQAVKIKKEPDDGPGSSYSSLVSAKPNKSFTARPDKFPVLPPLAPRRLASPHCPPSSPPPSTALTKMPFTPPSGRFASPTSSSSRVRFTSPLATNTPLHSIALEKRSASPASLERKKRSASPAPSSPDPNGGPMPKKSKQENGETQQNGASKDGGETVKEVKDAATE